MLIDELKTRMFAAMKAKDEVAKEAYRTAIGEVTKTGETATDERVIQAVRKMLKANVDTLEHVSLTERERLLRESALLEELLPKGLDAAALAALLEPHRAALLAAGNAGQATGIAMKALKAAAVVVDGKLVGEAVRALRGESA